MIEEYKKFGGDGLPVPGGVAGSFGNTPIGFGGSTPTEFVERPFPTTPGDDFKIPLEANYDGANLTAKGGFFGEQFFDDDDLREENPDEGQWILLGKVTINENTGGIVDVELGWQKINDVPEDTATEFYLRVASFFVGTPTGITLPIGNSTFGPVNILLVGGADLKWRVIFL